MMVQSIMLANKLGLRQAGEFGEWDEATCKGIVAEKGFDAARVKTLCTL